MRTVKQLQKFWDKMQYTNHPRALSGCQYKETVDLLDISDKIKVGDKILEVGVGLGYVTKGLNMAGMIVSALDISPLALNRVNEFCEQTYLVNNINALPENYFDFIICHNGIQHIPTYLLEKELSYIIRSLNYKGIFALEFISIEGMIDTGINNKPFWDSGQGIYGRNPDFMTEIINKCGGYVSEVIQDYRAKITNIVNGCFVYHVKKKI